MATICPTGREAAVNGETGYRSDQIEKLALPIFESKGWIRLLGVLAIVYGVLIALSIVGIIIAWLPIWMGVLLYQASSSVERAFRHGDEDAMVFCLYRLKTFFTIQGVLALIGLVIAGIMIVLAFMAPSLLERGF
jgi:hypothetical protein